MTDVSPFRALRYDTNRVDLSKVIAPPYDVISPEERARLWAEDRHSAIRLLLTRDPDAQAGTDYGDVAERLARWRQDGVLVRDEVPAFYVLRQRFEAPDGRRVERIGFFAALRLEAYDRRVVLPHERTMAAPKVDRLKLLRATQTNLSAVFFLYEDHEDRLEALLASAFEAASVTARDAAGVEHSLAPLAGREAVDSIRAFLAERAVVIADGHHRYETALAYRDARAAEAQATGPDAPFQFMLGYFSNAYAPGTLLLPIHRVVKKGPVPREAVWRERLPDWRHEVEEVAGSEEIQSLLDRRLKPLADRYAFAMDDGSGSVHIFSRAANTELAVRVIHREVLEGVFGLDEDAVRGGALDFPASALRAAQAVRSGRGSVALYLNPLDPEDVFRVTAAGEVLPQKSTFFHPKLPSGMVFRSLEETG